MQQSLHAASHLGWSGAGPALACNGSADLLPLRLRRIPREATSSAAAVLRSRCGPLAAAVRPVASRPPSRPHWAASDNSQEIRQWLRSAPSSATTTASTSGRSARRPVPTPHRSPALTGARPRQWNVVVQISSNGRARGGGYGARQLEPLHRPDGEQGRIA